MNIKEKIGKRLRELRTTKGLSQEKFSFECELDRTYIASIEQGRRNVSIANKAGKTRRPTCKDCRKDIDGVPLKTSEKKRMEAIKPEVFFVCPICKKASIPGVTANLVIDHDHKTGNAREWICDSCNTGLGRFKDNIELMQEVIKYLKKYNKSYCIFSNILKKLRRHHS